VPNLAEFMISPADRTSLFSEYYFSKKLREIRDLQNQGRPIINLGIGSPDLPPSNSVIEELCNSSMAQDVHGYQSYQGLPELQHSIKDFYQHQYGCDVRQLSALPLMGSKEGITHISLAYLNPGDQVLIPELGYPTYTSVSKMVGAIPIYYPLIEGTYEPNWEVIESMDLSRVKLMWLNYPHMPTGANGSYELFQKFVDFGHKNEILLCHDNPYSFIGNTEPLSIFSIPRAEEIALELNSVSKTFNMAGWRVGWVLGKESIIQPVLQIKSNMDSGMFYGIQKAAIKALSLENDWYETLNTTYQRRRELGQQIFNQLNCEYTKGQVGMFLWARAPIDGEEFIESILREYDVFLAPGFIFGERGKGFVRMSLCASENKLIEVINRLK
tara:strand:- start:311 stop:1465 length:1155 start_codon:yes stop_codon:yes gene_type:complete